MPKVVTHDADGGAFRPLVQIGVLSTKEATKSLPFILNHIMPAEFSGFGYQADRQEGRLNAEQRTQTAPLWSEINNLEQ
jgi:hypothetical protein